MRHIYRLALMLVVFTSIQSQVFAQCDPVLRPDSTQWGYDGRVFGSVKVGNTLYLGGTFTAMYKNVGRFAGLHPLSGIPVTLSWPKVSAAGGITAVISDGSNGFIIAGNSFTIGAVTRNGVAQINSAGQVTSWNPNANGPVNTIYRVGTTVYVGGSFTSIGGQTRNNIAAISLSTGLATSWNPNSSNAVMKIIANTTGTVIYAGGNFTNIGSANRNNIAALDATTGLATSWNPGANSDVSVLCLNGTTLYAGGQFTSIGGQSRTRAGAVSTTTGLATSWNPAPDAAVHDIIVSGSNILVGGAFSSIGSQSRNAIAEVDATIGNATATNYQLPPLSLVYCMKFQGTNDLYVGGGFQLSSGQENLIKINKALGTITTWEGNLIGASVPNAIEFNNTGNIFVGGGFSLYSKTRNRLAAIDMITDTLLPWNPNSNGVITAITANASTVYIAGGFTQIGGAARSNLASVDAVTGAASTWSPSPDNVVYSLVLNGTSLYVGGDFNTISGTSRNRLALYNTATNTLSSSWNPNVNDDIKSMVLSTNGTKLFIGGTFTTVGSVNRNRIAAIDLTSGVATGWNPNPDGSVSVLATAGSKLYVGGVVNANGGFNNIGGQFRPRLAELDTGTGNATGWTPYPNGDITGIAVEGSRAYATGNYTTIGGQARTNFAAIDIATGNATSWDPAATPAAGIIYVGIHGGRMLVSGFFNSISGAPYAYNAQYKLLETAPTVTILGKSSTCASTSTTYTAFTDVTGASYQWKRNGLNVGTNSPTYSVAPSNNDQIQCVITAPAGCYSPLTATSNTITVSIVAAITPTVTISGTNPACSGNAVTYTATTNVPNAFYQWKINGNNAGTSINTFTYTPTNGDVVSCTVGVPSQGCFTATTANSNNISMVVNTPVAPTISISTAATTVCAGASVTFNSTSNVTGGTYQWKRNGLNVGTNNSSFTTTTLVNGDAITCVITIPVGGCFTASSATSNQINMTVNANVVPTLTISGNTTPCAGASTTYTATTNVTGASYQWKVNGVNVGTNLSTYSFVPATGNVLSCVVTTPLGSCYTTATVTSNSLTILPQTILTPTVSITGNNPACSGVSNTYTATTNFTGASYQWRRNSVNVGTNSATYSVIPNAGDVIQCIVTVPAGGCFTTNTATSNTITVTLANLVVPTAAISTVNTNVCSGSSVNFTATTNITGATYQWKVNGSNSGTNSPGFNIPAITTSVSTVTCEITTPSGSCYTVPFVTSNTLNMNVSATVAPFASITSIPAALCANQAVTSSAFAAISNITSGPTYQWRVNGVNMPVPYYPVNGDVVTVVVTAPSGSCYTPQSAESAPVILNVGTPVTPTVTTAASANPTCQSHPVNYTATTPITGSTFQWKVNGVNVGTNMPTYSYTPVDDDIVLCTITTPPGCFTSTFAISTLILMDVKPATATSLTIIAPPLAEVGSIVTVTANIPAGVTAYSIDWKNKGVTFATTTTANTTYTKTAGIDTITAVITPTNDCYAVATSQTAYVYSVGTGISNIAKAGIEVFPNPFNNMIKVKGLEKGDKMTISDVVGRTIGSPYIVEKQENEYIMQVSDLIPGTYILRIQDKEGNVKANFSLRKL